MDQNPDDPGSDDPGSRVEFSLEPQEYSGTPLETLHESPSYTENNLKPIINSHSFNSLSESATPSQRVQFILGEEDQNDKSKSHDIFCELQEIRQIGQGDDKEVLWRETARWVKFEEDVAEEGDRWTKPHVATLSLHSLFELRKGLMTGSVLLDLDADDLPMIFDMIIENLVSTDQLETEKAEKVHELLMKKHQHQFEHHKNRKNSKYIKSLADIGRSTSTGSNMEEDGSYVSNRVNGSMDTLDSGNASNGSSSDLYQRHYTGNAANQPRRDSKSNLSSYDHSSRRESKPKIADIFRRDSSTTLTDFLRRDSSVSLGGIDAFKYNEHFAKKIAPGTQAANILVGETELVNIPIVAYVRLKEGQNLGSITEVAVPTRFIFLMLGPNGSRKKCHEIGRAIATLMCDEIFHAVAYHAKSRDDLLTGIDEFLDQVTVLPPGEWDPSIKIEPPKAVPSQEARKSISHVDLQSTLKNGDATPIKEEEDEADHCDPTLVRTGRLFGGLIDDIKRKAPFYLSDFKDALQMQCLASTIFMYFACLTPIVTFGGLLGSATDNYMGAMESLVSGFVCGISYHMLAGQPLTIIGSTGPILVFETIVYQFCTEQDLVYLTFRFWIGIWVFVILMVMIAFDLSALVRYITRFTEEAFAVLIALIFIVEAFKKLFHILDERPVNMNPNDLLNYSCLCLNNLTNDDGNYTMFPSNHSIWTGNVTEPDYIPLERYGNSHYITLKDRCEHHDGYPIGPGCDTVIYYPDVFFFSYIVFFKTFCIAYFLKMFRTSSFLPNKVRSFISDFSVTIAIAVMITVDVCVGFETPKLHVPESFKPTRDDRAWVVNPILNPVWSIFAAIGFAILATILIFMDQQITAVIINRKEHKLKKGSGYHLDLTLIAVQVAVCSVLGTPWFVAATVLSINHVRSLTVESECAAPGEKPKFLGVREQRVTGTLAFVMVGLSVLMGKILKFVPLPVLFGVFLYMGVASLTGLQLVQRTLILFMPPKYQPDYPFLEHVPLRRCHLFTLIQVICLALLWVIKSVQQISIVFPLMVLAMCFIRKGLDWIFTNHELKWLDDIMPITHRQKKKKEKQQLKDLAEGKAMERDASLEFTAGIVNIPLAEGEKIALPVQKLTYKPDKDDTEELGGPMQERKTSFGIRERKMSTEGRERKISAGNKERILSANGPTERRSSINPGDEVELNGGAVKIPLEGGKSIKVPVDKVTYDPNTNELNISEEMAKTTIWKQLVANELESGLKLRKRSDASKPESNENHVTINIDSTKL